MISHYLSSKIIRFERRNRFVSNPMWAEKQVIGSDKDKDFTILKYTEFQYFQTICHKNSLKMLKKVTTLKSNDKDLSFVFKSADVKSLTKTINSSLSIWLRLIGTILQQRKIVFDSFFKSRTKKFFKFYSKETFQELVLNISFVVDFKKVS